MPVFINGVPNMAGLLPMITYFIMGKFCPDSPSQTQSAWPNSKYFHQQQEKLDQKKKRARDIVGRCAPSPNVEGK
jgi:hypothetical protein